MEMVVSGYGDESSDRIKDEIAEGEKGRRAEGEEEREKRRGGREKGVINADHPLSCKLSPRFRSFFHKINHSDHSCLHLDESASQPLTHSKKEREGKKAHFQLSLSLSVSLREFFSIPTSQAPRTGISHPCPVSVASRSRSRSPPIKQPSNRAPNQPKQPSQQPAKPSNQPAQHYRQAGTHS
jgi:hypothetical protein